jgi:hypothetical protein
VLALAVSLVAGSPGSAAGAPRLAVTVTGSQIRISTQSAQAGLLDEIARESGAPARRERAASTGLPEETVSVIVDAASADDALRHLLRQRDHVLIVSPAGVVEIRIYGTTHDPFPPAGFPAPRVEPVPAAGVEETGDPLQLRADAIMHADPEARFQALDRLAGTEEGEVATSAALAVLERERDPRVLEAALDVLDGLEAVPLEPLLGWVARRHEPALRVRALTMLRERGEQDSRVRTVLRTLGRDEDEAVRAAARALLGELEAQRRERR